MHKATFKFELSAGFYMLFRNSLNDHYFLYFLSCWDVYETDFCLHICPQKGKCVLHYNEAQHKWKTNTKTCSISYDLYFTFTGINIFVLNYVSVTWICIINYIVNLMALKPFHISFPMLFTYYTTLSLNIQYFLTISAFIFKKSKWMFLFI